MYRTRHRASDIGQIETETADYLSCAFGLLNSLGFASDATDARSSSARIMANLLEHNCHACKQVPCKCTYDKVINYNLGDRW